MYSECERGGKLIRAIGAGIGEPRLRYKTPLFHNSLNRLSFSPGPRLPQHPLRYKTR